MGNFISTASLSIMRAITFLFVDQSSPRCLKKFGEDTPTGPEVIGAHTLNVKPNCKFLRLQFFGVPPSPFGCTLARLGQSLARVKNVRAQHPLRAEILCSEKYQFGWVNMRLYNYFVCGPKFTNFILSNAEGL